MSSNYYDMRKAKVRIAEELQTRGWEIIGFKEDESDMMTDYYSPADWDGIAKKNGFILCIDTRYEAKSMPIEKHNYNKNSLSFASQKKIEKLKLMTMEHGATEGEEANAKRMIEKLKNSNNDNLQRVEIIGYTTAHMANPGRCKWHIEKDGSIYDKGTGITKYADVPANYIFDINTMQFKDSYKKWQGKERTLTDEQLKAVKDLKKLILRWERVVNCMNGMGDGTAETEQKAQEQQTNEKMKKMIKKVSKKVWKMIEITDRKNIKVNDYLSFNYHGGYWKVTNEYMQKGTWKGIVDSRKAFDYEIVGSASRGYKQLKNPQRYYNFEYQLTKQIEEGKIKIYELKEVEEIQEVEKWVHVKTSKNSKKSSESIKKEDTKTDIQQSKLHKDNKEAINNNANTVNKTIEQQNSNNTTNTVQVRYNTDKNGIEVIFAEKPSSEILEQLKANGFRWSKFQKLWYAKDTQERRKFIKNTLQVNTADKNNITAITENDKIIDYPEIDIEDIESYIISKELSKQENNNAMFRNNPRDHQKELQSTLQSANDDVIELLKLDCSKHIEYKAKQYLQSFKSKYYTLYKRILSHRVYNPSWMVTGRGGLNVSRYNKKQSQLTNMEKELCQLIDDFNNKIEQFKNQIAKEQEQQLRQDIEQRTKEININDLNLVRVKKNYCSSAVVNIFSNPTSKIKGYSYNDQYFIFKNWGYWRIYNNEGNEIQLISRTTKSLEEAKKQLIYLLSQKKEKAV